MHEAGRWERYGAECTTTLIQMLKVPSVARHLALKTATILMNGCQQKLLDADNEHSDKVRL